MLMKKDEIYLSAQKYEIVIDEFQLWFNWIDASCKNIQKHIIMKYYMQEDTF